MPLNTFGVSTSDVTTDAAGNAVGDIELTVWTTQAMTVQVLELYDEDGAPLPGVVKSIASGGGIGRYPFKASDAYSALWLWDGNEANDPWLVLSAEALGSIGVAIAKADQASSDAAAAETAASTASTTATAADNRSTTALATANNALATAQSTLAATGVTAPAIADLVAPFYVAHRGGANVLPEAAMETYRAALDLPDVGLLEADVWVVKDGSTVVMHDSTVTRTTTGTQATGDLSAPGVQRLRIDAGSWFLSNWPSDLRVPTFDDFLDMVGKTHATCPQAGNAGAGQAIVDRVVARGLQPSTLVQSFLVDELDPAIAAGIATALLDDTGATIDWAAMATRGVQWAFLGPDATQANYQAAAAAGLRLGAWTMDRHVDRDRLLSWGVELIFSDDPWYMAEACRLTTDPFGSQSYYHGHLIGHDPAGFTVPRGYFNGDAWGMDANAETGFYASCLQGWGCPIKGQPGIDTFTIDFTAKFVAVEGAGQWFSVFIGRSDDLPYDDGNVASKPDGYHLLFRNTGELQVYKVTDTAATQLATVTCSSAPALGADRAYRIAVTPTQITLSVPGLAAPSSVVVTDSDYRGGYFHFGVQNCQVEFRNVTIS